jgi:hypothetical protein
MAFLLLLVGALLLWGGIAWLRRWWLRLFVLPVAAVLLLLGGYLFWYSHRPQPVETQEEWYEGITYQRLVLQQPRPLIVHIVTIRLDAPGITFLVTPPDSSGPKPLRGRTTSAFLHEHRLQVAINGGFCRPWHYNSPFDYYPRVGDPISVWGLAISNGHAYSPPVNGQNVLFITRDGHAKIERECHDVVQAISGGNLLVRAGAIALDPQNDATDSIEPRTAVALNKDESELRWFVIDGRQPNYSEGVTLRELAEIIRAHDGWTALHLDGGGSSTLVKEGADGQPLLINSPIHGRHPPGQERPVGNHLGVYARSR